MPEYQRSISIKVEINTNKATYNEEFEETYKAVEFLFNRLADEQRLEIMSNYCKSCGCNNPNCQCWNDD